MKIKHLLYLLMALPMLMVACGDEPESLTPTPTPDPSIAIEAGEATQNSLSFTITVANADSASWLLFKVGEAAPTEDKILADGVAIDVSSPAKVVAKDLVPNTEYAIVAVAVAGERTVKSEIVKMTTLAPAVQEDAIEFVLATAKRDWNIPAPANAVVLNMKNEDELLSVVLGLVGDEDNVALKAGTYSTDDGKILENSYIHITDSEDANTSVTFMLTDGAVDVAVKDGIYTIELDFYDKASDLRLIGSYEGEVEDMEPTLVDENAIIPDYIQAVCLGKGKFGLYIYFDSYYHHYLELIDQSADANTYYLNSGSYLSTSGGVNLEESEYADGNGANCGFESVDVELTINDDKTVTIVGEFNAENGDNRTIDWTGSVMGFNFDVPEGPADVDVEFTSASFQSISSYGDAAFYQFRGENGYQANIYFERTNVYPIKPGTYEYVNGYVNPGQQCFSGYESSFTLRNANDERVTGIHATEGYIGVEIIDGEYHITFNLVLDYLDGTNYTASYIGLIDNDTVWVDPDAGGDVTGEDIAFKEMVYKEYDKTYNCDTFTLIDDNGNTLDLIVYDDQATETLISASAGFLWSSNPANVDEFTTRNIFIDGTSYTAVGGDMQVVSDSSTGEMSIVINLSFDGGSSRKFTFEGTVSTDGGEEGGGDEGGNEGGGNEGGGNEGGGNEPEVGEVQPDLNTWGFYAVKADIHDDHAKLQFVGGLDVKMSIYNSTGFDSVNRYIAPGTYTLDTGNSHADYTISDITIEGGVPNDATLIVTYAGNGKYQFEIDASVFGQSVIDRFTLPLSQW